MSFEERFAAAGRALDRFFERARSGPRRYRAPRSSSTVGGRLSGWWRRRADQVSAIGAGAADWRRTLDARSARRLNVLIALAALLVGAGGMWIWTRARAPHLTPQEVQALSTLNASQQNAPARSSAPGPWWNRSSAAPASPPSPRPNNSDK